MNDQKEKYVTYLISNTFKRLKLYNYKTTNMPFDTYKIKCKSLFLM